MTDDRFRNFVARIARWTDEEVRRVSPTQVRHVAQLVVDGADPHYPPFDKVGFPADSVPHPTTEKLVNDFMAALKAKLAKAEQKYGFTDNWRTDDWEADCQRDLAAHVQKGDPLDVAAYAAFCWARGYRTSPEQAVAASGGGVEYTAEQYGYDAFHSGCSRLSPYPPSPQSVMWLTGYDVAANASRLSATPASLREVENLVRWAIRQWKVSDVNLPHLWSAERDETLVRRIVAAISAAPGVDKAGDA